MKPLRCLIIDDEPLAHGVIETFAAKMPQVQIVGTCLNCRHAAEQLKTESIDLIFLDIEMPRMTGLHFLAHLENPPLAVLTTAYENYALSGYELDVVDYLLKPFSFERFEQAIEKARLRLTATHPPFPSKETASEPPCILVQAEGATVRVPLQDLCYIEASGDYTRLVLCDGRTLTSHNTLRHWEEHLPPETFFKVHRSYLVSLDCVNEITASHKIVIQDTKIPIARSYRSDFATAVQKHHQAG